MLKRLNYEVEPDIDFSEIFFDTKVLILMIVLLILSIGLLKAGLYLGYYIENTVFIVGKMIFMLQGTITYSFTIVKINSNYKRLRL